MEDRILELGAIFAVAVYAYAVMSNQVHVVVSVDPRVATGAPPAAPMRAAVGPGGAHGLGDSSRASLGARSSLVPPENGLCAATLVDQALADCADRGQDEFLFSSGRSEKQRIDQRVRPV